MWKKIQDLFAGKKSPEIKQPPSHHNPHRIITTLFRRKKEESVVIKFLIDTSCYDTAHNTIFPQTLKAGTYKLIKTTITDEGHHNLYWYLLCGETRGLTELTLHHLIEKGVAQIIKH